MRDEERMFAGMKMKELCQDERPREKLIEKGAGALSNAELLAIMLRTGSAMRLPNLPSGRESCIGIILS